MCAPPGTVGTWEIIATIGAAPPKLLRRAAADLACEFVKACLGQDTCLPDGVRSIVRRGVSMDIEQITFNETGSGIPTVDMVIGRYSCAESDVWQIFAGSDGWRVVEHRGPYHLPVPG
jgi:hypothetical protein